MNTHETWQTGMGRIRHMHFVGVGGAGMSGIAEVLLNEGYKISGSDSQSNAETKRLAKLGATIYQGHDASQVEGADVVVTSTAVTDENVEVIAAKAKRIPVVARATMLGELMRFRTGIAVAGTHGKTTTTSLVASVLAEGGIDPTFVIGGRLTSAGTNARLGSSEYIVAEADESDASFLSLLPCITVVTNIDADHMEHYQDNLSTLHETFLKFIHKLPFYGLAIVCIDDEGVQTVKDEIARPMVTYGFDEDADWQASDFTQLGFKSQFKVTHKASGKQWLFELNMPGTHNVLNALAAIVIAHELGVSMEDSKRALRCFAGVGRRLQKIGELNCDNGQAILLDDYGHHPREITATLSAVAQAWPGRRVVMMFQPHRYTRTQSLFDDFSHVLAEVDVLLMLDVYSAGEAPIAGADSRALCRSIRSRGRVEPILVPDAKELPQVLANIIKPDDIVIAQGAGTISRFAADLIPHFNGKS